MLSLTECSAVKDVLTIAVAKLITHFKIAFHAAAHAVSQRSSPSS